MFVYFDDIFVDNMMFISHGSIQIDRDEIVVIRGENGSGKTLLAKNIFHNNKNKHIRIVFVEQSNIGIVKNLDVIHNITMSVDNKINYQVKEIIEKWGIGDLLHRDTSKLSGGEKRIISILRAFFSDAELLIFDEPTNDLDFYLVQKFIEIIHQIRTQKRMIIVSHDDRIDAIANRQYCICRQNLQAQLHAQPSENVIASNSTLPLNKMDKKILDKLFSYNFIPLILVLIFLFLSVIQMCDFLKIESQTYNRIPNNQINVYIPISITMNDGSLLKGYPAVVVKNMNEIDPIKQLTSLNELESIMDSKYLELSGLNNLHSDEMITVYPLEYYNPQSNEYIFTVDRYLKTYHNTTQDTAVLDTEGYFEQPFIAAYEERGTFKFDVNSYRSIISELESDSSQHLIAAVIVLNDGFSMNDFYNSDTCNYLANSNVYMASNEIEDHVITIMTLQNLINKTRVLFVAFCCLLLIILLTDITFCKTQLSNFKAAEYYGFNLDAIIYSINKQSNNRIPFLFILLVFILINVGLYWGQDFQQVNYYFSFCVTIFLTIVYQVNKWILSRYFFNAFRWNSR